MMIPFLTMLGHSPAVEQPVTHGPRIGKQIALTFDACQTAKPAGYDARIIATLRTTRTKATLFLGGAWMESHPAVTRALGRDPLFEIAGHSYDHPHMTRLSEVKRSEQISRTQAIQRGLTGQEGRLFRPPYGEYDPALVRLAGKRGLKTVLWSIVTGDPEPDVSAEVIVRTVLSRARPGDIVIMHMNGRGWHTAEALPAIIEGLRKKGFTFATVSELLASAPARRSPAPRR